MAHERKIYTIGDLNLGSVEVKNIEELNISAKDDPDFTIEAYAPDGGYGDGAYDAGGGGY